MILWHAITGTVIPALKDMDVEGAMITAKAKIFIATAPLFIE